MIGRLKDKMETSVKAVSILNRVYSGIDVKKAARKLLILSVTEGHKLKG